jgi:hypothetical protein
MGMGDEEAHPRMPVGCGWVRIYGTGRGGLGEDEEFRAGTKNFEAKNCIEGGREESKKYRSVPTVTSGLRAATSGLRAATSAALSRRWRTARRRALSLRFCGLPVFLSGMDDLAG